MSRYNCLEKKKRKKKKDCLQRGDVMRSRLDDPWLSRRGGGYFQWIMGNNLKFDARDFRCDVTSSNVL